MRWMILFFMLMPAMVFCRGNHFIFAYFTDNGQDGLHLAYSKDGLEWKALRGGKSFLAPTAGEDKLMRDPFILQGKDGMFHMVWTCSWKERQIGYASSPDLVHWSGQKSIPVMAAEPEAKNCWAPEMVYDPDTWEYIIFWATTIPGRHSSVGESASEKGLNHRIYCTSTRDFVTFSPTRMFFNPEFSVIDATILPLKKRFWMFLKNENPNPPEKNIRLTISDKASGPYPLRVSPPITGNYWAEGPSALLVGRNIYLYFDKYRDHRYGALRTVNMKDWEDISGKVVFPPGTRHGCAFRVSEKVYRNLIDIQ